jgi:pSer/pThr/pTyr-binding forkhead associated (FHA) protein
MQPRVRLIERGADASQTREIPITQQEFLIGRGTDCDLRLRVTAVSRHHCIIRALGEEVTVVDLGSRNGTFVNDQRVRSSAVLHSGDELKIGTCSFVVNLGDKGSAALGMADVDPIARTVQLDNVHDPRKVENDGKEPNVV